MYQFRLIRQTWRVLKVWGRNGRACSPRQPVGSPRVPLPWLGRPLARATSSCPITSRGILPRPCPPLLKCHPSPWTTTRPACLFRTRTDALSRARKHTRAQLQGPGRVDPLGWNSSTHSELFTSRTSSSWSGRYIYTGREFIQILWQQLHLYDVYRDARGSYSCVNWRSHDIFCCY